LLAIGGVRSGCAFERVGVVRSGQVSGFLVACPSLCQKEVAVQEVNIDLDDFCGWLCLHENDEVGRPGIWFHTPLAVWLSEVTGRVYGVDGRVYGRACWDVCCWYPLPHWAVLFSCWIEQSLVRVIVGAEALDVLAQVERALTMRGRSCGRRRSISGKGA
jgi:hypothetical protein